MSEPFDFAKVLLAARLVSRKNPRHVARNVGIPEWRLRSLEDGTGTPSPGEFGLLWNYYSSEHPR
jgi:hypothetical protein